MTEAQKITLVWGASIVVLNFFCAGVTAYYILIGYDFWALFWLEFLALGLPTLCYMAFRSIRTAHAGTTQNPFEDLVRPMCAFCISFIMVWFIGMAVFTVENTAIKDFERIDRNLKRMAAQGAPKDDVQRYLNYEGVTAADVMNWISSSKSH